MSILMGLKFVMPVIYFCIGIYFFSANEIFNFSELQKIGFGILLIAYGTLRFYVSLRKKRESESENDNGN